MPRHKWGEPDHGDPNYTYRRCQQCPMIKITRHEPDNFPVTSWTVWDRGDGEHFNSETVPECTGVAAPKKEKNVVSRTPAKKTPAAKPKVDHPYRLAELRVVNFRKLKAVCVRPDGAVMKVSGRNEQGKSALLDTISAAILGKKYFSETPVREGEETAEIMLDFGGLKITRTIWKKEDGSVDHKVVLQYADGKRTSRQDVLNELLGSPIADDPLAFSKMKPKEQYDLLKGLVPDIDFDDLAERRADLFETRTQVGREFERLKGAVLSAVVPADVRADMVDVTSLAAKLAAAADHNATIDRRAENRERTAEEAEAKLDQADILEAQAAQLRAEAGDMKRQLHNAEPLPDKIDAAAIEADIANAEAINAGVRALADRTAKIKERDDKETEYETLTKQITAIDQEKSDAIAKANLPVPGLSFGDEKILLDGLPFSDASTARKIRTATALLMAMKPDLRVLLIREGSLLDVDARAALEADAEANGFVVLMECVGDGDGSGVIIEDGEVV